MENTTTIMLLFFVLSSFGEVQSSDFDV